MEPVPQVLDVYGRAAVGLLIEATSRHPSGKTRPVADAVEALHDYLEKGNAWTYEVATYKFDSIDEDIRHTIFADVKLLAGDFAAVSNVRGTLEKFLTNLSLRRKPTQGAGLLGVINR